MAIGAAYRRRITDIERRFLGKFTFLKILFFIMKFEFLIFFMVSWINDEGTRKGDVHGGGWI